MTDRNETQFAMHMRNTLEFVMDALATSSDAVAADRMCLARIQARLARSSAHIESEQMAAKYMLNFTEDMTTVMRRNRPLSVE